MNRFSQEAEALRRLSVCRKNYKGLVNVQSLGEHAGIASTDVTPLSVELYADIQEIGAPLAHVVRMEVACHRVMETRLCFVEKQKWNRRSITFRRARLFLSNQGSVLCWF